ncbi:MAG TPA: helix-turn-helix transcriptional regulator [Thermoanaerobaculia bacterium]|jgi:AraC-like DNA-binding protein|nr:helix-turn-helix transcriptional regulator [Thermoanaerobaculia bacterium]
MTHDSKEELEASIGAYLAYCYEERTAARATELATFLGINRRNVTRVCVRFLGAPAKEALRSRQLSHAAALLQSGARPVDEIGAMCGFGNRTTFYRAFRRAFGCSPRALRKAVPNCD